MCIRDSYEMGLAAAKINSFIWDVYCDWFIEIAKPVRSGSPSFMRRSRIAPVSYTHLVLTAALKGSILQHLVIIVYSVDYQGI